MLESLQFSWRKYHGGIKVSKWKKKMFGGKLIIRELHEQRALYEG
jgi:hypothetical protein